MDLDLVTKAIKELKANKYNYKSLKTIVSMQINDILTGFSNDDDLAEVGYELRNILTYVSKPVGRLVLDDLASQTMSAYKLAYLDLHGAVARFELPISESEFHDYMYDSKKVDERISEELSKGFGNNNTMTTIRKTISDSTGQWAIECLVTDSESEYMERFNNL